LFTNFLLKKRLEFQPAILGIVIILALFTANPPVAAQQGTETLEARVSTSSDDAEESITGNVSLESNDLELVRDRSNQFVGMRFNEVDLPPRANIISAYIQFRAARATSETTFLMIQGEAADNAATFTTSEGDISARPRTSAFVAWSPEVWLVKDVTGPIQRTPDIASVIQEITLRPGWQSGNSLVILITGSGMRIAEAYDGRPFAAPLLHVEYALSDNSKPTAKILSPLNRSTFNQGYPVTFTATAQDLEDGNLTTNITWTSSLDGDLGTGGSLSTAHLSVGVHTIQAIATDGAGLTGSAMTTVTVFENTPVLVGAGDIAYEGFRDDETAKLLETIPGIVFTLGDNVYRGAQTDDFNRYYEPTWGRHKARIFPAIGDHEYDAPGAYGYFNYFGTAVGTPQTAYYSYNVGDWHIIVLNTECARLGGCGPDSHQGKWLQADLAANPGICTLAYFHDPLFSSSAGYAYPEVKDFWRLLYNAEVDVILNGHAHNYERFAPQDPDGGADPARGIREFVVGTGGRGFTAFDTPALNSEVRNTGTAGVLKLTLKPTSYDWEFIPIAGQTFTDAGSADCVTSSPAPKTPTSIASTPKVDTPVPTIPTTLPNEHTVPALTATLVQMPNNPRANSLSLLATICAILPIPILAYLLLFFRRQSGQ
jgi:hypothetical protein